MLFFGHYDTQFPQYCVIDHQLHVPIDAAWEAPMRTVIVGISEGGADVCVVLAVECRGDGNHGHDGNLAQSSLRAYLLHDAVAPILLMRQSH